MSPHPSPAHIRPACREDSARLTDLSGQLGYPATPDQVERRLGLVAGSADDAVFVAEAPSEEVAGWVHISVCRVLESEGEAEVCGLVVDQRFRGSGLGRLLMDTAEHWAREKGCLALRLRSNIIRTGAHTFYERLDYQDMKTQKMFRKAL